MNSNLEYRAELVINGKKIVMNPFVQAVFVNVTMGLVGALKDAGKPEQIVLTVQKPSA